MDSDDHNFKNSQITWNNNEELSSNQHDDDINGNRQSNVKKEILDCKCDNNLSPIDTIERKIDDEIMCKFSAMSMTDEDYGRNLI